MAKSLSKSQSFYCKSRFCFTFYKEAGSQNLCLPMIPNTSSPCASPSPPPKIQELEPNAVMILLNSVSV